VISFHELDRNLTRVMVTLDFHPSGMLEKMASGLRFVKRAVQADLARFKAYVELGEAEGVEYTHEATTEAQNDDGDDAQASSNGRGDPAGVEGPNGEEREQTRQERAERRKQRRS
jgi:hypothetical protein